MSNQILRLTKKDESTDCAIHPFAPKYDLNENYDDHQKFGRPIAESTQIKFISPSEVDYFKIRSGDKIELFDRTKAFPRKSSKGKNYSDFWTTLSFGYKPLEAFNIVIEEAKYMLDLEEGWDGDIASPIDPILFNRACKCISDYIEAVYNDKFFVIQSPSIDPVGDGSIDFTWRLNNARMLINFKYVQNRILGHYYGDLQNNEIPIKGNVPTDKVYEHLMKWMQNLK
ncbi:hypothetical protein [uncultured Pedobacter sp.]|uniref:hypothetical protein n=1 Tax=uncultured Pedobacter sp. TaxID=246139 RepID=UPI0025E69B62|nr:hypothetical protein [uncultured Pedobacter sp.]